MNADDIQTHRRSSRADQRQTTVEEATRVLVAKARAFNRAWSGDDSGYYEQAYVLCAAVNILNTATRAAAARKRAGSVKP